MLILFLEVFNDQIRLKMKRNETVTYARSRSYFSDALVWITRLRVYTFRLDLKSCIQDEELQKQGRNSLKSDVLLTNDDMSL